MDIAKVAKMDTGALGSASADTRTTGCTCAGQLGLRAEQKVVVDAVVTENCSKGSSTTGATD